jgi:hypothetical protein
MNDRELTKILAMINSKVKKGVEITYKDIEEQVLRTRKMCYTLCPSSLATILIKPAKHPGVPHVGSYMLPIITMLFLTSSGNASSASTSILNLSESR